MEYLPTRRPRIRTASEVSNRSDLPDHLAELESPMYGTPRSASLNDLRENFFAKEEPEDMITIPGNSKHLHAVSERYESLNYETVENDLYRDEINMPTFYRLLLRKNINRWVVCFLCGATTAGVGAFIAFSIKLIVKWKFGLLQKLFNESMQTGDLYVPLLVWIAFNCFFTLAAVILVVFVSGPVAAGSGIPQIKCFLNGVKIPGVVSLKTLAAKAIGVLCSISGGLTVGREGPMIHTGACIAARISQGKTADGQMRAIDFHIFQYYRTDTELRDFVACGAAAGVAAAFGAPIGGVLFSLEEGASFWNQGLTWRMFFGSMVCGFVLNLLKSLYEGGRPGNISWMGLADFGTFHEAKDAQALYQIQDLFFYAVIGVIGGLLGALFNYFNRRLTVYRIHYNYHKWQKITEAMLVAAISAIVPFLIMIFFVECKPYSQKPITQFPVQLTCPYGEYSVVAALFMQTPEEGVRNLFHNDGAYSNWVLLVYFVIQFALACWTYGISVASGLFLPCLLIGAAWGRMLGSILNYFFPETVAIQPGLYALAGAAAQLGGITRMTISLCVILIEATQNIAFGLPLMIVLMIAKWVGDYFTAGIYDVHIDLAEVPLLASEPPHLSAQISAKKVMAQPVIVLRQKERVRRILEILQTTKHSAYPVVDHYEPEELTNEPKTLFGRLKGMILRYQLIVLLQHKTFSKYINSDEIVGERELTMQDFRDAYPLYERALEKLTFTPEDLDCWLDVRRFMNQCPYTVTLNASLTKMYQLFRGLGLRHIVVIDQEANEVVGIVTRKDIARFRAQLRHGQVQLNELLISEQPPITMGSH